MSSSLTLKRPLRLGRETLALSTALLLSSSAGAAPPNALGRARAQFQQGLALETAGDWAGALGMFQEVASVKMTPQIRFNIAVCEEHLGKLAAALGDYQLAASEAQDANAPDVSAQVAGRIDALRARISKIVIERGEGAEFASISLDGVGLGAASIGAELPVDPGPHTVEGRAPGFNIFMTSFNIAEKEVKSIHVTLPRGSAAGRVAPGESPRADEDGTDDATVDTHQSTAPKRNLVPYIVGGVGAASVVTSIVFFALRAGTISELDNTCGANRATCPNSAEDTRDRGRTYNTIADVTLALGVLGLGTGVVLFLTQEKPKAHQAADGRVLKLAVGAPGAAAGMTMQGSF